MIEAIILFAACFILARALSPRANAMRQISFDQHDTDFMSFAMTRCLLPRRSFTLAQILCGGAICGHILGLSSRLSLFHNVLLALGALMTGFLAGNAVKASEHLVTFEAGTPDAMARKGLMFEFVIFPMVPITISSILGLFS